MYDNENCILFTGSDTVVYEQSHTQYISKIFIHKEKLTGRSHDSDQNVIDYILVQWKHGMK